MLRSAQYHFKHDHGWIANQINSYRFFGVGSGRRFLARWVGDCLLIRERGPQPAGELGQPLSIIFVVSSSFICMIHDSFLLFITDVARTPSIGWQRKPGPPHITPERNLTPLGRHPFRFSWHVLNVLSFFLFLLLCTRSLGIWVSP